jgi:hypothetical protein
MSRIPNLRQYLLSLIANKINAFFHLVLYVTHCTSHPGETKQKKSKTHLVHLGGSKCGAH